MNIKEIESALEPLRNELRTHKLYKELSSVEDIKLFMENHVYAVWDFMSLLKGLQIHLTCTTLPWQPSKNTNTARFINEIVLEEETDRNEQGILQSHFEMYLEAMEEVGANTAEIKDFLKGITALKTVNQAIENSAINIVVKDFLRFTFDVLRTNQTHKIAAAFTFGREDLIPDMFLQIIEKAGEDAYPKLGYYLKRHIELDGDDHGPLSLKMIQELCGRDEQKWQEVGDFSQKALEQRIALWNHITLSIKNGRNVLVS